MKRLPTLPALLLAGCAAATSSAPPPRPTTPAPAARAAVAAPTEADCNLPGFRAALLARINAARAAGASCGNEGRFTPASPLAWNAQLARAAQSHSLDIAAANALSHTSRDGRGLRERIDATGYAWRLIGENVAGGDTTVDGVMAGWLASPPHCANLLNPGYTEVGAACVLAAPGARYATFWTMKFAAPR